jgi:hypothetical protein
VLDRPGKVRGAQLVEGEQPDVVLGSFADVPSWLAG